MVSVCLQMLRLYDAHYGAAVRLECGQLVSLVKTQIRKVTMIERRAVLQCTLGAFWTLLYSLSSLVSAATENGLRRLDWAEFVGKIAGFAESRSRGHLNSGEFVRSAAAVGTRLNVADKELRGTYGLVQQRQALIH